MHMFDADLRFMGGYGIVGGHLPLAVGIGYSIRIRRHVRSPRRAEV
jgi:pyruvate dehydrogenase E1 component alpha subunit